MITFSGLKMLRDKKQNGEMLPEGWEDDVREYLRRKRKLCEKFGGRWRWKQYARAENISKIILEVI